MRKNGDQPKDPGYDPIDIIRAPAEPPPPPDQRKRDAPPPESGQRWNLLIGFVLVAIAVFALPIVGIAGSFIIAAVGALFIAIGTMVRA